MVVDNIVQEYYYCAVKDLDARRFAAKIGESGFTTSWECLALLIGARLWLTGKRRCLTVQVRSDSLGALRMAFKLSSKSKSLNFVAQEFALQHMTLNLAS